MGASYQRCESLQVIYKKQIYFYVVNLKCRVDEALGSYESRDISSCLHTQGTQETDG